MFPCLRKFKYLEAERCPVPFSAVPFSRAPVRQEIPPDVIREAIVNAIAHRDYTSAGAVQVSVFADRVEAWNPGALLPPLTLESLRQPHGSIARNPRICEALFLTHYIEKYGTGTLMMIRESLAHALPEPDFAQRGGEFTVAVWRDWLTAEVLAGFHLNERQLQAVKHAKVTGRINNAQYRDLTGTSERTALRELRQLTSIGIFDKVGGTGQSAHYAISKEKPVIGEQGGNPPRTRHQGPIREPATNPPNPPREGPGRATTDHQLAHKGLVRNWTQTGQTGHKGAIGASNQSRTRKIRKKGRAK